MTVFELVTWHVSSKTIVLIIISTAVLNLTQVFKGSKNATFKTQPL